MRNRRDFWRSLSAVLDLPAESFPGTPLVELLGEQRLIVEGHCGIEKYGNNNINVKMKYGGISVRGEKLQIIVMSKNQLVITGMIENITVLRSGTDETVGRY